MHVGARMAPPSVLKTIFNDSLNPIIVVGKVWENGGSHRSGSRRLGSV